MLENLRGVVVITSLASMTVLSLRILLPGEVVDLAPQTLRLWAFSAVYLAAGRLALDWTQARPAAHGELASRR